MIGQGHELMPGLMSKSRTVINELFLLVTLWHKLNLSSMSGILLNHIFYSGLQALTTCMMALFTISDSSFVRGWYIVEGSDLNTLLGTQL